MNFLRRFSPRATQNAVDICLDKNMVSSAIHFSSDSGALFRLDMYFDCPLFIPTRVLTGSAEF
jgi:hypothetical protein